MDFNWINTSVADITDLLHIFLAGQEFAGQINGMVNLKFRAK